MALPERCAVCGHRPSDHTIYEGAPRQWSTRVNICKADPPKASELYRCACEGYQPASYASYGIEESIADGEDELSGRLRFPFDDPNPLAF